MAGRTDLRRIESLQVVRAVAAAMVVVLHATNLKLPSETAKWRFDLGAAGVDLFFVVSGIIIFLIPKRSAGDFLKRRVLRIVPLYFLVSLLALPFLTEAGPMNVLTMLTFWPAWGQMTPPVLSVGWTLCFEMLFYLGAAAVVADRRALFVVAAAFPLCMAAMMLTRWPVFQFLGNPVILEFGAGLFLGYLWTRGTRLSQAGSAAAIAAGLALWLLIPDVDAITTVTGTMTGDVSLARVLFVGIPAALIVWGTLNLKLRWPAWLIGMGDASYSVYLAHAAVLTPLFYVVLPAPVRAYSVAIYLLISALTSFAVYQLIEQPIVGWTRKHTRPRPAVAAVAQAA